MGNSHAIPQHKSTDEYPSPLTGLKLLKRISAKVTKEKNFLRNIRSSLQQSRPKYAPPMEIGLEHPKNWLWESEEWSCYADENGYFYYFNTLTNESTWDPPSHLQQQFNHLGAYAPETIPLESYEGIDAGEDKKEAKGEEDRPEGVDNIERIEEEAYLSSPSQEDLTLRHGLWEIYAALIKTTPDLLESRYQKSVDTLQQVANGDYNPENLIFISWAYQFHQCSNALFDSYFIKGDTRLTDCSLYDNCDGIPAFSADNGFVEWFLYTETSYEACCRSVDALASQESS